jgi:hypothetical protein
MRLFVFLLPKLGEASYNSLRGIGGENEGSRGDFSLDPSNFNFFLPAPSTVSKYFESPDFKSGLSDIAIQFFINTIRNAPQISREVILAADESDVNQALTVLGGKLVGATSGARDLDEVTEFNK